MMKSTGILKIAVLLVIAGLLAACAPGELERILVSDQSSAAGQAAGSSAAASPELPPVQPACPTPTPAVGGEASGAGEINAGEAVTGPASPPEAVSGIQPNAGPAPEALNQLLDQVNQGPGVERGSQASGEAESGPAPNSAPGPGGQTGDSGPASGAAEANPPGLSQLIGEVVGQILGTSEPGGISFEPASPSPTPCP